MRVSPFNMKIHTKSDRRYTLSSRNSVKHPSLTIVVEIWQQTRFDSGAIMVGGGAMDLIDVIQS